MELLKEDEEAASQDQKMIIDVYPLSTSVRVGQPIPLKLEIRPVDSKDTIPRGTIIVFDPKDSYFEPLKVTVTKEATFSKPCEEMVILVPHAGVKESDFKGQISYKFTMEYILPNSKRQINLNQGGKISLPTGLMRGDFETPYPINVLLFGQHGNGKSATTNRLLTSLSVEDKPTSVVRMRQSDVESNTRGDFETPYPINVLVFGPLGSGKSTIVNYLMKHLSLEDSVVRARQSDVESHTTTYSVFDVWGIAQDNYVSSTLPMVMKGRLLNMEDVKAVETCKKDRYFRAPSHYKGRRAHQHDERLCQNRKQCLRSNLIASRRLQKRKRS